MGWYLSTTPYLSGWHLDTHRVGYDPYTTNHNSLGGDNPMSHFTCVNSKINSETLLVQTLQACGLEVQRGAQIVGYQGTKSDTVYPIVGHSQQLGQGLGYIRNDKGFYVCHFHDDSSVGALMAQVARAYAVRKARQDAQTMTGLKNASVSVRQFAAA